MYILFKRDQMTQKLTTIHVHVGHPTDFNNGQSPYSTVR